jgi:MFS transporter, putative metabolite transport protein
VWSLATAGKFFEGLIVFMGGIALPTAHMVISESIPAALRGRLVLGAFSFQAVGAVLGTAIAAVVLGTDPRLEAWRIFYLIPVVPVSLVLWGRLFLPESSHWLVSRGQMERAQDQLRKLLGRSDVELEGLDRPVADEDSIQHSSGWRSLFQGRLQRATILASVPWFLQDISTYGIGIFTPVILAAAFGATAKEHTVAAVIHNDLLGARGTALVDLGFLVGIACAIALADRWGRIPLQILGFVGCAVGLLIAAAGSAGGHTDLPLIVAGFVLFQFMTNLGPNAQTYLLAGEVFPTPVRGLGAGLAAATGKVGAVLTAFLFPILLADWGTERLLPLLAVTSLAGAAVTWIFRIETTGRDMNSL